MLIFDAGDAGKNFFVASLSNFITITLYINSKIICGLTAKYQIDVLLYYVNKTFQR